MASDVMLGLQQPTMAASRATTWPDEARRHVASASAAFGEEHRRRLTAYGEARWPEAPMRLIASGGHIWRPVPRNRVGNDGGPQTLLARGRHCRSVDLLHGIRS